MDRYEQAVMFCLVANGETFVAPQFGLGKGGSLPDFVAIRPPKKRVYVVEVTSSGNPTGLVEKVNEQDKQWMTRLKEQLEQRGVGPDWSYAVLVFVRRDQYDWFKGRITNHQGVTILCLEDAIAGWEWNDHVWTSNFSFETNALKRSAAWALELDEIPNVKGRDK